MTDEVDAMRAAFGAEPHLVAYAVKANSAGPILRALASRGAGADVVSGAELELAVAAGVVPGQIVYSGVAKLDDELDRALSIGWDGILALQAESIEELPRIAARARAVGRRGRVSLRLNPDIEADTHSYIATGHDEAKFGIPIEDLGDAIRLAGSHPEIELVGLGSHIGSQLTTTERYAEAAETIVRRWLEVHADLSSRGGGLRLVDRLRGRASREEPRATARRPPRRGAGAQRGRQPRSPRHPRRDAEAHPRPRRAASVGHGRRRNERPSPARALRRESPDRPRPIELRTTKRGARRRTCL
jgi:diaminopimelate decarboxylase